MAEFLLNEENRKRLADMMQGIQCPPNLDRATYVDLRHGGRSAVSVKRLDAIARACGYGLFKNLSNSGR